MKQRGKTGMAEDSASKSSMETGWVRKRDDDTWDLWERVNSCVYLYGVRACVRDRENNRHGNDCMMHFFQKVKKVPTLLQLKIVDVLYNYNWPSVKKL